MRGSPLILRAEMSLWVAGRGVDLILKDEWRPSQRSLSFFPPPGPAHPCTPTPLPYPASLPRFSAPHLHLYMHAKSPRLLPHLGWGNRGLSGYLLQRCLLRRYLRRCPLMLKRLLCLGRFVAGEHRCGCGQFGAGHECGAEGCELACVTFGYAEQGQQLGGRVGHDGLQ